jgi:diamine N-acetyltransferase
VNGHRQFALSYLPRNTHARQLYLSLGFVETGETEGDEIVARLGCES